MCSQLVEFRETRWQRTEFEEKPRIITPRNSRRNEILAILLLAVGLLLTLCLVSAAFYPNDPSWNSAGQTETRNWAGAIGANVAALLIPVDWARSLSLAVPVVRRSLASLQDPQHPRPLLSLARARNSDAIRRSFTVNLQAFSQSLIRAFSRVDWSERSSREDLPADLTLSARLCLLIAIAATGLLLATNFSFIDFYEKLAALIGDRFAFVGQLPAKIPSVAGSSQSGSGHTQRTARTAQGRETCGSRCVAKRHSKLPGI